MTFGELTHFLPLRDGFNVTITLPRDLTPEEAKRIATWLAAMAIEAPWKREPPAVPETGGGYATKHP